MLIRLKHSVKRWPKTAVLIFSADSYVGVCDLLYTELKRVGCKIYLVQVGMRGRATPLSEAQRQKWRCSFEATAVDFIPENEILEYIASRNPQYVFLGMPGRLVYEICIKINTLESLRRHLTTVTCFPGLQYYMKYTGLMRRAFVDILLFMDADLYQRAKVILSLLPLPTAECVLLGTPRISSPLASLPAGQRRYVGFFEQNEVPRGRASRHKLAERLSSYIKMRPDLTLLIITRSQRGEYSNHSVDEELRLDSLMTEIDLAPNVEHYYGNWLEISSQLELALSVSSTALLEARLLGIPAYSVSVEDSGRLSRFDATRLFQRMNASVSFEDLELGRFPTACSKLTKLLVPLDPEALAQAATVKRRRPSRQRVNRRLRSVVLWVAKKVDERFYHYDSR